VKRFKAVLSFVIIMAMILSTCAIPLTVSAANLSEQLYVSGNKLLTVDGNHEIRLVGVNVPGGEWTPTPGVEQVEKSATYAIEEWGVNCIRLPIAYKYWMGVGNTGNYPNSTFQAGYKRTIKNVINIASEHGVWVILDNHGYTAATQETIDLWNNISQDSDIKDNPTVLFGILNEPHGTTWDVWKNGNGSNYVGLQAVVKKIRDNGAKNIIVAGGLDWSYNLKGIVGLAGDGVNYALSNVNTAGNTVGYGIMYDSHIYPWKGVASNFDAAIGEARRHFPIVIGELGWGNPSIAGLNQSDYQPGDPRYYDQWIPMVFSWLNDSATYGAKASYTCYSMHYSSAPAMLEKTDANGNTVKSDAYTYPTTPKWGTPAVRQIAIDMGNAQGDGDSDTDTEAVNDPWEIVNTYDPDLSRQVHITTVGTARLLRTH
jgi:hypothetical protein